MTEKEFQLYVDSLVNEKGGMLEALHAVEMKIDHIEFLIDVRAELIARINMN
jgi:hypothetical protein